MNWYQVCLCLTECSPISLRAPLHFAASMRFSWGHAANGLWAEQIMSKWQWCVSLLNWGTEEWQPQKPWVEMRWRNLKTEKKPRSRWHHVEESCCRNVHQSFWKQETSLWYANPLRLQRFCGFVLVTIALTNTDSRSFGLTTLKLQPLPTCLFRLLIKCEAVGRDEEIKTADAPPSAEVWEQRSQMETSRSSWMTSPHSASELRHGGFHKRLGAREEAGELQAGVALLYAHKSPPLLATHMKFMSWLQLW